jgi:hypothetical protein
MDKLDYECSDHKLFYETGLFPTIFLWNYIDILSQLIITKECGYGGDINRALMCKG